MEDMTVENWKLVDIKQTSQDANPLGWHLEV